MSIKRADEKPTPGYWYCKAQGIMFESQAKGDVIMWRNARAENALIEYAVRDGEQQAPVVKPEVQYEPMVSVDHPEAVEPTPTPEPSRSGVRPLAGPNHLSEMAEFYDTQTVPALKKIAAALRIPGRSSMVKAELVEAIVNELDRRDRKADQ
jgi:hypothetical protein